MAPLDRSHTSKFLLAFHITTALSCRPIIPKIKLDIGRKLRLFSYPNCIPPYAPRSSRFGSEPPSVEDDVDIWRYAILRVACQKRRRRRTVFDAPLRSSPSEYCYKVWYRKTRIMKLPENGKIMACIAISMHYWHVMDRKTDGKDILQQHSSCYAYAQRGNKATSHTQPEQLTGMCLTAARYSYVCAKYPQTDITTMLLLQSIISTSK